MYGMTGLNGDLLGEFARLQENLDQMFRHSGLSNIRASARRTFPAVNVGSTDQAIEVLALAPGVAPETSRSTRGCW